MSNDMLELVLLGYISIGLLLAIVTLVMVPLTWPDSAQTALAFTSLVLPPVVLAFYAVRVGLKLIPGYRFLWRKLRSKQHKLPHMRVHR